ncbi:MAG: short-chain dehydrogenase [Xanthomarina sp.]|jgi:3-oxoacyl-[acyl-carrier protein] reductase|uniref:Short-chain dehydrogenase n=2 Tax=Xanthomarina gelatinilytica TaxID=1137281 RepID=A0A3C0F4I3_9FLAO|nr:SDR family oxidoreductase [Xanthomarina sp.]MCB0387444.1 SDR family oxidoreductase [Winogradskyella sp.]MDX1316718.1 SDR family oxidoreductase [Xanthomarina gelatinilytica]MAL21977.1 short-chain dehydrogenase [Xanthomarina sp.]MBF62579.1 short-chain dehydrogenase [Xanthomarina sp.]HAI18473.1 short-chain dehydrogenase [Xanthomarina gelatinilytica]|tara:strand:+ start:3673 stop:4455 length:783 start_codon:yes stop_codon:yes gene_type:complete
MNLNLNNKYALVCGSTAGIGKATAMSLAAEGAIVTLIARNEDKLKTVLAELPQHRNHDYIVADFSNPEELKAKVSKYVSNKHGFHILVNNTGGPKGGPVFTAELNEFESAFTQHLKCNHVLAQAVVPFMKEAGYGRIINIISTSVKQPLDGLGVSNTIRGAVANWSKTLANELGSFGITVNNVLPGATGTERLTEIIKNKSAKTGNTEEEAANAMKQAVPAKRFAKPEELAYAVTFLASECASYINGINLPVDGGRTKSL